MNTPLSPILLFTYNRIHPLRETIAALKANIHAAESSLFVFSDGAKSPKDDKAVLEVRNYVDGLKGFKKISVFESPQNKGLANSIIEGVTKIINEHGKVIVLEDDLVSSRNFLSFMNQSLNHYEAYEKVLSIAGFSMPINGVSSDAYFTKRISSWGWATWKEKWNSVDWAVKDYSSFARDEAARIAFNKMGSDLSGMLDKQMRGNINSWAIRWCYHQFKHDLFTVYPAVSKIINVGLGHSDATHTTERFSRFKTTLDVSEKTSFSLPGKIELDPGLISQFIKPYSIPQRIKYKLLNKLINV